MAIAQVSLAADLASECGRFVRTTGHKDKNALLADAVILFINERDLTMTDFAAASNVYTPDDIARLQQQILIREGVDSASRRALCFYARRIAGGDHPVGRFLERR